MKLKLTLLAISVCSIATLSAQTAAPEKPATEKAEELKAATPVEKQAFKMLNLMKVIPEILGNIKDEASLAAAEPKFTELVKKVKAEEEALLKLPIPDNTSRTKISKQRQLIEKTMTEKMEPIMTEMLQLDPTLMMKLGPMMQNFAASIDENRGKVDKYFKTDEELKNEKE